MNFIGTADLQFDTFLLGIRTPFFLSVFDQITLLGEASVIIVLTGLIAVFLWRSAPRRAYLVGLVTAVFSAGASGYVLKLLVARARPDDPIPALIETSYSFPSMHATLSMALYGFAAYLLYKRFPGKAPLIITVAVFVIGTIGFSRLYLGVHFPSDVLGGYLLGGLWLLLGIRVAKILTSVKTL